MKKTNIRELTNIMKGKLVLESKNEAVSAVCIDSRKVNEEDLFFAIIGEKQDGHIFLEEVIEKGCFGLVVSHENNIDRNKLKEKGIGLICVQDTTVALQKLAASYISSLTMKKIGVTGSVGKTTTKEMLYYIFSERYRTYRNPGNKNNHIGLPLSVLDMNEDMEVGIFEMGMSEFGEIDLLASIIKPNIGIITTVGTSHIENLKSREGILKAKLEMTNYLNSKNFLIINSDNDLLGEIRSEDGSYKTVKIGTSGKSDFILSNIIDKGERGIEFSLEYKHVLQNFIIHIPGRHNAYNASLAVAAAVLSGMSLSEAAIGLEKIELTDKRLSIKGKNGIKVIDDTYNASPESMKAAIDVLVATKGLRKVAILGDMFEMGDLSEAFHRDVGRYVCENKIDKLICIGFAAKYIAKEAVKFMPKNDIILGDTKEELENKIDSLISMGDVILVKGSRGMEMDKIVKKIMEK